MELRDTLRRRRMVRDYLPDPLPAEQVDRVVSAALRAPSAGNSQGWAFVVLDRADTVARFWQAATPIGRGRDAWSEGMRRAPVLVLALSHRESYVARYAEPDKGWPASDDDRWPVPYWHVDTGMAVMAMLLTAVDEGLGACFFGVPGERVVDVLAEFGIPAGYTPIGVVSVGHAAAQPARGSRRPRRARAEVVRRNGWDAPG